MAKKKDLGKGIRALLSNIETKQSAVPVAPAAVVGVSTLLLSQIEANVDQPRKEFDKEALEQLASSIKQHGIIQPLTVRKLGGKNYQLISGERRFRASKMAGLKSVPVYIREANDVELLEMALIENIQREDLNALEIAISYNRLLEECKLSHEELAERVAKKRSTVSNYVRLLKLPPDIQNSLIHGAISMGHARALAGIEDISQQLLAHKETIAKNFSVRQLESWIKGGTSKKGNTASTGALPAELISIKQDLKARFGTNVDIQRSKQGKGKISINFKNDRELNYILDILND